MSSAGDRAADGGRDGISRRTLIRILVGLGIGIPIIVEGLTFLGLVGSQLGDDDGGDGDETDATPERERVGTGEELLPETDAVDTLATTTLVARDDAWKLSMTVEVENTTEQSYQLRLDDVVLTDGNRVAGGGRTEALAPGETAILTGRWDLPPGSTPTAVEATGIVGGTSTTRTVPLEKIPVQGG
jgi:hypothetical protein